MGKPLTRLNPSETQIVERIHTIRGLRIMIDNDLADMYGVETKVLNQAVKRNIERFPDDFMFELTKTEWERLRSQIVTLEVGGRGRYPKYFPKAFTEQGVAMLSSVLRSKKAIEVNIQIIRVYHKMRKLLTDNKDLWQKLEQIEREMLQQGSDIEQIFTVLEKLLTQESRPMEPIGFKIPAKR